jgi:predicted TPR repeat methyltransferase
VLAAARRAATPGALLVFTVEALETDAASGFRLQPHGRYAHARPAVERWLTQSGWRGTEVKPAVLRQEAGLPVAGWVFSARADAPIAPS